MKNTEKAIQEKFLKLLEKVKIDEVDVNMICNSLKIKRQTFYYHYKNIYDVIFSIFYEKKLDASNTASFIQIIKDLLEFLYEDHDFHLEILQSNANDIINDFCFSYLYKSLNEYLTKYKLTLDQKKEEARFFAKAIDEQILFYFANPNYSKEDNLFKVLIFVNEEIIVKTTRNFIVSAK